MKEVSVKSMKEDSKYDEWSVECAAKTLMEAEEYKKDSKMMKLVTKHLKKKKKAIESIQDLRDRREELDE